MLERLAIVLIVVGVGIGVYTLGTRWQVARIRPISPILRDLRPGIPAIVYFWSETCAPCKLVQEPALRQLQTEMEDGIQVIAVNALEQPEVANEWGVLSLPTTFIIDGEGRPRRVNHGVVQVAQLRQQILSVLQPEL